MADVNTGDGGGDKKHGKTRAKKSSTRIDMTPMVDLGFLLLTFFILTTTFNKPQAMEISMPVKDENLKIEDQNKVPAEHTFNMLLTQNNVVYWYFGMADPNLGALPALNKTSYSKDGLRKVLITENNKRHNLYAQIEIWKKEVEEGKLKKDEYKIKVKEYREKFKISTLVVLIKPDKDAKYKNIVDALDEMAICNVGTFALLESTPVEDQMIINANSYVK